MSAGSELRPSHDWQKLVLFVLTCVGAIYMFGDKILAIGKSSASIDKIDRIEAKVNSQQDDITSIRYEAKAANAAAQRVEVKVDDGFKDINTQLRQLNITGRHR